MRCAFEVHSPHPESKGEVPQSGERAAFTKMSPSSSDRENSQ